MAKAAETAEKASGALARGNTKEATETAKAGAAMLHELARQVKGEIARDVAQELAMARDLADELAEREAELGQMPSGDPGSSGGPEGQGRPRQVGQRRKGRGRPRRPGRLDRRRATRAVGRSGQDPGAMAQRCELARRGRVGRADPGIARGEDATQVVERMERIGELYLGGQKPAARREAAELARILEVLARQLDVLHQASSRRSSPRWSNSTNASPS